MLYLRRKKFKMDKNEKKTIEGFKPFSITEYDPNCPIDSLFINQELIRVKYASLHSTLKRTRTKKDRERLENEIEQIKDLAAENAENIKKRLEDKNKTHVSEEEALTDKHVRNMIEQGKLKPKKKR